MISGGIKFFEDNQAIGSTITALTGQASTDFMLDSNKETFWRSIGSSDAVTETLTIEFDSSKTIDRIFLKDTNAKSFNIKYDLAGAWTDFSNISGIDGSKATISETSFSENTAYYEFDSVITSKVKIEITETQNANAEKYINQLICTEELATLVGYPEVKEILRDRNIKSRKTTSGLYSVQKSFETYGIKITFKNYPSSSVYNVDIDAMITLEQREDPFLVWLCGGRYETKYITYQLPGYRLKDVFKMQVSKAYKLSYMNNVTINPLNLAEVNLVEHI